jgi:hypothetical protein
MNNLLIVLLFLSALPCTAQDYPDLIIRNNEEWIKCRITLVNDANIFYSYRKKKTEWSEFIPLSSVKEYYQNGTKGVIISKPDNTLEIVDSNQVSVRGYLTLIWTAGDELIIAHNHYYLGMALSALGGVVVATGANGVDAKTKAGIGGGLLLIGAILMIESWSHIGRAGELLKGSSVSLGATQNGLGLCYRF